VDDLRTFASLLLDSSKLLQVDISGPWCTIDRTSRFELAFSLATAAYSASNRTKAETANLEKTLRLPDPG
jgi:hypothetical protein